MTTGVRRNSHHPRTGTTSPTGSTTAATPAKPATATGSTASTGSSFDSRTTGAPPAPPTTPHVPTSHVFDVSDTTPVSASPIRDAGELSVAWRAVETKQQITRDIYSLGDGSRSEYGGEANIARIVNTRTSEFMRANADNLKNFVRYGQSALTPYETAQVMQLLGFKQAPGEGSYPAWYSTGVDKSGVGGHVELTYKGQSMHGIRAFGDDPSVLAVVDGQFKLLGPSELNGTDGKIDRVISPPLVDKRWFHDSQYMKDTNPYWS